MIYQSTTYKYESTAQVAKLFDLTDDGHMYSRISNPTVAAVEEKIAALEGGVGALCTTSGQAATLICILNILRAGDHILCASTIYGGTINLFAVTSSVLVSRFPLWMPMPTRTQCNQIQPNTKAVFAETIANPAIAVLDIEKMARVAHSRGIPLIVDNTFATPVLCRPFEYGADIVVHSTTKYMDGHATQLGGVIVDSGNFDWTNGNFPEFTEPDQSYHGVVYTRDFGRAAYITKARVAADARPGLLPFCAGCLFAQSWAGNAAPADGAPLSECRSGRSLFAAAQQKVESVNYPTLAEDPYHQLAQKYLPNGCSGVISFSLKGGREAAVRFIDSLKLASLVVHVADVRTLVLHPATRPTVS